MSDISYRTDTHAFSYRVAAICIHDNAVLLQTADNDFGYAFPGGQVAFGETHEESLMREFAEEFGTEISVGALKWVGELFFPVGTRQCHQICLYYLVKFPAPTIPMAGSFPSRENALGKSPTITFHWVPLSKLAELPIYPTNASQLLCPLQEGVQHFIYREL